MHTPLNQRQKAFLLVATLLDFPSTDRLLDYLSEEDRIPLKPAFDEWQAHPKSKKKQVIRDELKQLGHQQQRSLLTDLHPDWILETLHGEDPRMVATILRYLPDSHVHYILEHMTPARLQLLPPLFQTFALDSRIVRLLRQRFEQNFYSATLLDQVAGEPFMALSLLKAADLRFLMREVGYGEMAMAFAKLDQEAIQLILRRLNPRDAGELKNHLAIRKEADGTRLEKAQNHLLHIDFQGSSQGDFLLQLGFLIYSKAVLPQHLEAVRLLQYKFSTTEARLMKKYLDKNLPYNSPATVAPYQKEIMARLKNLKTGKLDA